MRIATWVVVLLSLPLLTVSAATNRIVLEPANVDVAPIQKMHSSMSETGLAFRMAGVESEPVELASRTYQSITPITSTPERFGKTAEEGMPDLPALSQLVAIPDQSGIRLEIVSANYQILDNFEIVPTQPSPVEGSTENPPFIKNERAYENNEFYPLDLVQIGAPMICRDLRLVQTIVHPVQYNPVTRQLRVYTSIDYHLMYEGIDDRNVKVRRDSRISEAFLPLYRALTPNADDIIATYEPVRGGYLILTKALFVDSLQQLAMWKHKKGYSVYVAATNEITPSGNPTASQVHAYLQSAYNQWAIPPEYVMIVGDNDNLTSTGIPDYPYSSYSSDHNYSTLEGTDYLPDVFVARLSVDNITDLRKAVAKIMMYEANPNMSDPSYWLRGLSVAGNVGSTTPRLTVLWVRELLMENGFTHVDTSFRWGSGQSDPYLAGYFNEGMALISYRGWAGSDGWWSPTFYTSDLNALQNSNKLGIMASIVCGTGDFGVDVCFGETWIRMGASPTSLKGGPAFFGTTDHNTHTRWNNPIIVGYYWGLFHENISHFAAAAVRGKIQLFNTFPSYSAPGGTVEQYLNTYNMLGDPELEVRTRIPVAIAVTHPASLPFGVNHIEINAIDESLAPVEGAYVTLVKGIGRDEEVFEVGKTDASGDCFLSFDALTTGTMSLTVSGRDLRPYQGQVQIVQSDLAVGYDSLSVNDQGDGLINPGETIQLGVILKNFGTAQTANGVTASLEPIDSSLVTVYDATRLYGSIPPGQRGFSYPFVIGVSRSARDGDIVRLKLSVTDNAAHSWYSVIELLTAAPKFTVSSVSFPGGNGRLDPGETINMVLFISNGGAVAAQSVTGEVTTIDDYTTMVNPHGSFGDIAIGGSANNAATPMVISTAAGTFDGRIVNLILHTTTAAGAESYVPFTVTVGAVATSDPTGPDAYGYYMYDNTDVDYLPRPTYSWVEINPNLGGSGTRINFANTDDNSQKVTLPFNFFYYGQQFNDLIVCINGFIAPDTTRFDMAGNFWYNFFNWPIPDPGSARGQISPFWDDLQYSGTTNGVYYWYDATNHRFIIEWSGTTNRNTSAVETFQLIITDPDYAPTLTGDSDIFFQYSTINNNDSGEDYASVGFESYDELRGLQYTFDNDYMPSTPTLAAQRAIKITTSTGRGGLRGAVVLNGSPSNMNARLTTSSGQYRITPASGEYWMRSIPPGTISVTASAAGYFPTTMDNVVIVQDQTTGHIDFNLNQCPIPENMTASEALGDRIEVNWSAVNDPDFVGYNLYRSLWEGGDYILLNASPITSTSYTDYDVPQPVLQWYYVTALYSGTGWTAESFPSNKDSGITFYAVPDYSYYPESISASVAEGDSTMANLVIKSTGTGNLIISLQAVEFNLADRDGEGSMRLMSASKGQDDSPHVLNTWLFISPAADTIAPNDSLVAVIHFDASFIGTGDYTGQINLATNDPENPSGAAPVYLNVHEAGPVCQYISGDVNNNAVFNGIDVTYAVGYFKGGPPPPYSCLCPSPNSWYVAGDVNASCVFNGIDVTYMVAYFKGGPAPAPCPLCPPTATGAPGGSASPQLRATEQKLNQD